MIDKKNKYYDKYILNLLAEEASSNIEIILNALNIDVYKVGNYYKGPCPIHDGDNPGAFTLYINSFGTRITWLCWTHHCESTYGKTLFGLIKAMLSKNSFNNQTVSWINIVDWLIEILGYKSIDQIKSPDAAERNRLQYNCISHRMNGNKTIDTNTTLVSRAKVRNSIEIPCGYYLKRGYDHNILDKYDVGLFPKQNRAIVPVYNNANDGCVGYTARSIFEKCPKCKYYHALNQPCPITKQQKRQSIKWATKPKFKIHNHLYNYWFAAKYIKQNGVVILVEGPGDVWKLEQAGIHSSLAIFGTELSNIQERLLIQSGALSVILLMDNDEAGQKAAHKLQQRLSRAFRIYHIDLKKNDIGDYTIDEVTKDIQPLLQQIMEMNT